MNACLFDSCSSTSRGGGGAIRIHNIYIAKIYKSTFLQCRADDSQGGGIRITSVMGYPLLRDNFFISCNARLSIDYSEWLDDGGGVSLYESSALSINPTVYDGCRFIECRCAGSGGALIFHSNTAIQQCINTLFVQNQASEGSGVYLYSTLTDTIGAPFRFCFFCKNIASTGTDIYREQYTLASRLSLLFHSFSILTSSIYNGGSNWLPQTIITDKATILNIGH